MEKEDLRKFILESSELNEESIIQKYKKRRQVILQFQKKNPHKKLTIPGLGFMTVGALNLYLNRLEPGNMGKALKIVNLALAALGALSVGKGLYLASKKK